MLDLHIHRGPNDSATGLVSEGFVCLPPLCSFSSTPPPILCSLKLCCLLLHSGIDTHAPAHQSGMDKVSSLLVNPSVKNGTLTYSFESGTSGNLWSVCGEQSQSCEKGSANARSLQEKKKVTTVFAFYMNDGSQQLQFSCNFTVYISFNVIK